MMTILRLLADGIVAALLALAVVLVTAGVAEAQRLRLTITSGAPIAFPAVTEAHYDGGSVPASAALAFSVQLTGGAGATLRTGIVSIRAAAAVMGGAKPIADLQWRRNDLGVWNSLTTSNVTIESRTMRRTPALNNPWANSVLFRTLLSWANDPPATYTPTVILTTTLTTP
jgi:hypothetical protein